MNRINWKFSMKSTNLLTFWRLRFAYLHLCWYSLLYNDHLNASYATDVCMEPLFWFVDNYVHLLGPFFVGGVALLTAAVVCIAYWIGLPYWWQKSPSMTVILMIVGNWLLINVVFHYTMAVKTPAGEPPKGISITNAVSICKKCILPKPPRTHHCSVCNKCILKMDHHCPWLNNCVGFGNHRYFILYMIYTTMGSLFLIIFGCEIGYNYLWLEEYNNGKHWMEDEPLYGQPVKFNRSGHIIPASHLNEYDEYEQLPAEHNLPAISDEYAMNLGGVNNLAQRRALIFMAFINVAVVLALGTLSCWHMKLITRGETSIEAHINHTQRQQMLKENKTKFINPYNFGAKKNWLLFLGLVRGRTFWRTVLLPSRYIPDGKGLTFHTIHDYKGFGNYEWP